MHPHTVARGPGLLVPHQPPISAISFRQAGSDHLKMSPPEVAMCPDSDVSVNDSFKFRSSLIHSSDVVGTKGLAASQWNIRTQRFIWSSTGNNDENFDEAYCIKPSMSGNQRKLIYMPANTYVINVFVA